jgi:hypothetical protein
MPRYVIRNGEKIIGQRANQCNHPDCLANTGQPCLYVRGPNKGKPRKGYHKVRTDRAVRTGMIDRSRKPEK